MNNNVVETFNPVFYRTYSRYINGHRENWQEVCDRTVAATAELGEFTPEETKLIRKYLEEKKVFCSGRWLWVGGTEWIEKPENFPGAFNCSSTTVDTVKSFEYLMELAMMGCGTGAILERQYTDQLPPILTSINLNLFGEFGEIPKEQRREKTLVNEHSDRCIVILVGDSREGWSKAYSSLISISMAYRPNPIPLDVNIYLGNVRPSGERLQGFGGTANPIGLRTMFSRVAAILNGAVGRKLTPLECCLLIDEAAKNVVAGNVRRSAGMRQFDADDDEAAQAKMNLWSQAEDGSWRIDPAKDALRMANHTRVFHEKPTYDEVLESVKLQYQCGEGAIQWAGEAKRRAKGNIYGLNPCGEILLSNNFCNLSEVHLNQLDPSNMDEQHEAFRAAALHCCALLKRKFTQARYQESRDNDPIVGISFTGLFDFMVKAFGIEWLQWWEGGRIYSGGKDFIEAEKVYLTYWRKVVEDTVAEYCNRHGLKCPNRCTTVQPAGTKSLLTGASPGWHPPKAARYIRRITFGKNDPVARAMMDHGFKVTPSQSDKDEYGVLLNDPFDERCTEWLVEIPVEMSWANLSGADQIQIEKFSVGAQFDFYMQVQKHYTAHNSSCTLEYREHEIEELATLIHKSIEHDEGYISAALLARFDAKETYPRLPFEPISKETYDREMMMINSTKSLALSFDNLLAQYDQGEQGSVGPAPCDSDACLLPDK